MGDAAARLVHVRAAELLDRDDLAGDGLDDVRAGQEHRARAPGHDHEVGQGRRVDGAAGARPEDDRDLRDDARGQDVPDEDLAVRGEARDALLDPCAARIVEADDRHAALEGEVLDPADLVRLDARERAADDGEVLRERGHPPAADLAEPGDHAIARVPLVGEPELGLVVGGQRAHLLERAVVEEERETLARRELAAGVLLGDPVEAAALERPRPHRAQDLEMVVHAPIVDPRAAVATRPHGPDRAAGWIERDRLPESRGPALAGRPSRDCDDRAAQLPPSVTSTTPFWKSAPFVSSVMPVERLGRQVGPVGVGRRRLLDDPGAERDVDRLLPERRIHDPDPVRATARSGR